MLVMITVGLESVKNLFGDCRFGFLMGQTRAIMVNSLAPGRLVRRTGIPTFVAEDGTIAGPAKVAFFDGRF